MGMMCAEKGLIFGARSRAGMEREHPFLMELFWREAFFDILN